MKKLLPLSLGLVMLCAPLQAQQPADYDGWTKQAAQLMVEHAADEKNGTQYSWDEGDKAKKAGLAYLEAAKLATDDAKKFAAYDAAGQAFDRSKKVLGNDARDAFAAAFNITSIAGAERARVGLEVARRTLKREDYEKVTAIRGATDEQLATAYSEIASKYVAIDKQPLEGAKQYLVASNYAAKFDISKAEVWLGMGQVNASKATPSPEAVDVLDKLFKAELALPPRNEESAKESNQLLRRARINIQWGERLEMLGQPERAIKLWQEVGGDTKYNADYREEAWLKVAAAQEKNKKLELAVVALEEAGKPRGDNFVFSEKIAKEKVRVYTALNRLADALKVWQQLAAHPKVLDSRKEELELEQAKLLLQLKRDDEANAILTRLWDKPQRSGNTINEITFIRVQRAADQKQFDVARAELDKAFPRLKQLDALAWAPPLYSLSGGLYAMEKKPREAMAAYAQAIRVRPNPYSNEEVLRPTQQIFNNVQIMFRQAIEEKRVDEARAIADALKGWEVMTYIPYLMVTEIEITVGNYTAASGALEIAKGHMRNLYGQEKVFADERVAELAKKIPAN